MDPGPWTLDASADALGQSLTSVRRAARSLECRGLLVSTEPGHRGAATYRATPAGVALRTAARERSAQHLRYALAGLTADQVGVLRRAAPGIAGLTVSLGFRDCPHHVPWRRGPVLLITPPLRVLPITRSVVTIG